MKANANPLDDDNLTRTFYNRIVDIAEGYNQLGAFTSLRGFE